MQLPEWCHYRTALPAAHRQVQDIKPVLIILDNRAQIFLGNENDRAQATYSANFAAGIARPSTAASCSSATTRSPDSEYSGSTAWDAVTRSRWWLHRVANGKDEEPDLVLERRKTNYAPPDSIKLVWRDGVLFAADERQ